VADDEGKDRRDTEKEEEELEEEAAEGPSRLRGSIKGDGEKKFFSALRKDECNAARVEEEKAGEACKDPNDGVDKSDEWEEEEC
jgi:hypothetical protein